MKAKNFRIEINDTDLKYFKVICQLEDISMTKKIGELMTECVAQHSDEIPEAIKTLLLRGKCEKGD